MAVFGRINEFCPDNETLSVYLERVDLFFAANNVPDENKVPLFLTVIGATAYSVLHNLVAPASPKSKSFEELVTALKLHYEPKPLVIAERFHFYRRNQASGESIAEYVAELRRLATTCSFGDHLDEALRDRIVCGVRSEAIQKRLLSEADPTLATVVKVAQGIEAAHKGAQAIKPDPVVAPVVSSGRSRSEAEVSRKPCYRCGLTGHFPSSCNSRNLSCHKCGKLGHLARVCRSQTNQRRATRRTQWVESDPQQTTITPMVEGEEGEEDLIFQVGSTNNHPYEVVLEVDGKRLRMEIDTGASVSLISQATQKSLYPRATLSKPKLRLRTYTQHPISVAGTMSVRVKYEEYEGRQTLHVVEGCGPSLLGRDWMSNIRLNWQSIRSVSSEVPTCRDLVQKYAEVFEDNRGTMQNYRANLSLREGARPQFHRPRSVPFAIRDTVGQELDRLEETGVLRKVNYSEWAAPIVPVPKKDGSLRICGDYKMTINPFLLVDQYPLPNPSELLASLTGGRKFTKLDLTAAYTQMALDDESSKLVTINTHKGLYQYLRLPFGVASAPALFQRAMDGILQGIPHVVCYMDDILVTGTSAAEHAANLEEVLKRLKQHGLRLREKKCAFYQDSVQYLGHTIDCFGIHTSPKKVAAVADAPTPQNVSRLRSFLGMVNYYGKFIPNLSSILQPLHKLLCAGQKWEWSDECDRAFKEAKRSLTSAPVLAHYDPNVPLQLAGDASHYGMGAVLAHVMSDGSERPIAYASRTLSQSEQNYSQIEKEALSLVFGIKKFHQFLYGRDFMLLTDHKPLTSIFGPKRGIPPLAAARMQRWALFLSAYSYTIRFRPTQAHGNADALSRLPMPDTTPIGNPSDPSIFNLAQVEALPIDVSTLSAATKADPVLSVVLKFLRTGWPSAVPNEILPYWHKREDLAVEGDCLLRGTRVIIPTSLRPQILQELHQGHPGIVRMKSLARSHVWWPHLDQDVEQTAKACVACQEGRGAPPKAPLHPWAWPTSPMERIHVDYAGPVHGKMLLVVYDAHSKWPEVYLMSSTTSSRTVAVLRELFARYGIPQQLVSDNGPQFVSQEFESFLSANGVKHIKSAPYHPASNGAAERLVQTVKQSLRAACRRGVPVEQALAAFLMQYRTTPHSTTGVAPSDLFLGRTLRTRLDMLHPGVRNTVTAQQQRQKQQHDRHSHMREFPVGHVVWTRNWREGPRWVKGVIVDRLGPLSYLVRVRRAELWRRHVDQLRDGVVSESPPETGQVSNEARPSTSTDSMGGNPAVLDTDAPDIAGSQEPNTSAGHLRMDAHELADITNSSSQDSSNHLSGGSPGLPSATGSEASRYPQRTRQPPDRLM